jgi:Asp-tRNA(Asn)/Glu-tRNA(Gln) amidotransferase A subunit family amidase
VPYGFDSQGLPVGVQVVGPANGDEAVLSVAGVIERIADDTATDRMWQRRLDRKGAQ